MSREREPVPGDRVRLRRVYEQATDDDGLRVLVDRIWPRGLRKDSARLDHWIKDAAPSTELRKWYRHEPAKFDQFEHRYRDEPSDDPQARAALGRLRELADHHRVTLLTATRDIEHSQAAVLQQLLQHNT
jgi:uncharacterized protein YeaO (DUF488 family)